MSRVGKKIIDDMKHNNATLKEINRRVDALLNERDGYKARDKLRGEALELFRLGESDHFFGCGAFHKLDTECSPACVDARAAIAITPQDASKKEGK